MARQQSSAAATLFAERADLIKVPDRMPAFVLPTGTTTAISSRDFSCMAMATGLFVAQSDSGALR
jgi:hypothetical protein